MPARENRPIAEVVPKGVLIRLKVAQIRPNPNNPRRLFDPEPLSKLLASIREHGVLVPLTVYKLPGQRLYAILDGERRYRCCEELQREGADVDIPANIVEAPDEMASLIYMFNIHSFREPWELMPTAFSLKEVMKQLHSEDNEQLRQVTGLSHSQIERCKKILTFPAKFQKLSLEVDPAQRIPSNFWVELHPVLEAAVTQIPDLYKALGRDGLTERMIEKYKDGRIRSVIHFRRIMEAFEVAETAADQHAVADRLREFILTSGMETREAFDGFIRDTKRIQKAVDACDQFVRDLVRTRLDYTSEGKEQLISRLSQVVTFAQELIERLAGEDPREKNSRS